MKGFLVRFLVLSIGLTIFLLIPKEEWGIWIFVFYGVCIVLTSIIGHCIYKKYYWRAVLFTVIMSPIVFTIGGNVGYAIYHYSDNIEVLVRNLSDMFMWSGVASMYSFLYTFPVAFPVSMIVGDIFNWYRRKNLK